MSLSFAEFARKHCGPGPIHVGEVAVFSPALSQVAPFVNDPEARLFLVEPLPNRAEVLRAEWPDAVLHQVAVMPYRGEVRMHRYRGASYVEGVPSPATTIPRLRRAGPDAIVPCCPFEDIDPGDLDALNVDVEGSEWNVFQTMKSRPKAIQVEWWHIRTDYEVPYGDRILDWLVTNGYREVHGGPETINRRFVLR